MGEKAIKGKAITKVLSCLVVIVFLMSVFSVAVIATNSSNSTASNVTLNLNDEVNSSVESIALSNNITGLTCRDDLIQINKTETVVNESGNSDLSDASNNTYAKLELEYANTSSPDIINESDGVPDPDLPVINDTDIDTFRATAKTVSSTSSCSYVWIKITDKYCKGYKVYVDGVYQFIEGGAGGVLDGYCHFTVTPGYHTFKLTLNGKEVSKGWNCQCGVVYNWESMNEMDPHWCEDGGNDNPTDEYEVKFQGIVTSTTPSEYDCGFKDVYICEVKIEKVIFGDYFEKGDIVNIVYSQWRENAHACGTYDKVSVGDTVEVYGEMIPIYCVGTWITICGKSSYYLKKIDSGSFSIDVWTADAYKSTKTEFKPGDNIYIWVKTNRPVTIDLIVDIYYDTGGHTQKYLRDDKRLSGAGEYKNYWTAGEPGKRVLTLKAWDDYGNYAEDKWTFYVKESKEKPSPKITDVDIDPPICVKEGEYATISVTVKNNGGPSSEGYISVSFPHDEYIPHSSVTGTGNGYNELYLKGHWPLWNSKGEQMKSVDPLVELKDTNWRNDQEETITMKVKPNSGSDKIVFYVRAALKNDADGSYERDPTYSGNTDQQGWYVKKYSVDVCAYEEVKFRGEILVDYPIISFYSFNVKIDEVLDDPTGNLQEGETVNVYGHRSGPAQVDDVTVGDEVEVFGEYRGYVGTYEQIFLSDWGESSSDHYVKRIEEPDLIIQEISWNPSNPKVGDTVTFTVKIKNRGTRDATAFHVYYYIDGTYHDTDTIYGLSAGSTTTQSFTWIADKSENVQIKAVADATNAVDEGSNEENNELIKTMADGKSKKVLFDTAHNEWWTIDNYNEKFGVCISTGRYAIFATALKNAGYEITEFNYKNLYSEYPSGVLLHKHILEKIFVGESPKTLNYNVNVPEGTKSIGISINSVKESGRRAKVTLYDPSGKEKLFKFVPGGIVCDHRSSHIHNPVAGEWKLEVYLSTPGSRELSTLYDFKIDIGAVPTLKEELENNDYDVLIMGSPREYSSIDSEIDELTDEEIDAIVNYVNSGGNLLLIGMTYPEGYGSLSGEIAKGFNTKIIDKWGDWDDVDWNSKYKVTKSDMKNHQILNGINEFYYYRWDMDLGYWAWNILETSNPIAYAEGDAIVAAFQDGGRVVIIGSGDTFENDNIDELDHRQLAINIMDWLSSSEKEKKPDLIVEDIFFSKPNPVEGERIEITAKISNIGNAEANVARVDFYQNSYFDEPTFELDERGATFFKGSDVALHLKAGSTVDVSVPWRAVPIHNTKGENIKVVVDELNWVEESNDDNNVAYKSISVQNSEFDISVHGYHFENYDLTESDIERIKGLIKADIERLSLPLPYLVILDLFLLNLVYEVSESEEGGHCYGMSSTSILYQQGEISKPINKETFYMLKRDNDVLANINAYQAKQAFTIFDTLKYKIAKRTVNLEVEFNKIKDFTEEGTPVMLLMWGKNVDHAVVAIDVYEDPEDLKYVIVYDNNLPGMATIVTFDLESDKVNYRNKKLKAIAEYPAAYPGDKLTKSIRDCIDALKKYLTEHNLESIIFSCPVNATITDQYGRVINDRGINEIPNARIETFGDVKIFFIPADFIYQVNIEAYDSGEFTFGQISPIAGNAVSIVGFTDIPITENTKASVGVEPGVTDYTMSIDYNGDGTTDEEKSPDVSEIIEQPSGEEYKVHNLNTGEDFATIQSVIDDPDTQDGHTITVDPGTYNEHLVIDKPLKLMGEDKDTTIIDGEGSGNCVHVTTDNVEISGFTVQNGTYGILLESSDGCTISGNIIQDNYDGIRLTNSNSNAITNNIIFNNVFSFSGIHLSSSHNNVISDNELVENGRGISLYNSNNNLIYHNNFIDSIFKQAYDNTGTNLWDNGYPSGGNYWSDYTGVDLYRGPKQDMPGSDDIGDTPYCIPDGAGAQDRYPLMHPWEEQTKPKLIWTLTSDKKEYSQGDYVFITVELKNEGEEPVFITNPITTTFIASDGSVVLEEDISSSISVTLGAGGQWSFGTSYKLPDDAPEGYCDVTASFSGGEYVKTTENLFYVKAESIDTTPPVVISVEQSNDFPEQGEDVTITAHVTDNIGVTSVTLGYDTTEVAMTLDSGSEKGGYWSATIPGQPACTTLSISVTASDAAGNTATFGPHEKHWVDTIAPTISNIKVSPTYALPGDSINISAKVFDYSGVKWVRAYINKDGELVTTVFMSDPDEDGIYAGTWQTMNFTESGIYNIGISAIDTVGNEVLVLKAAEVEIT